MKILFLWASLTWDTPSHSSPPRKRNRAGRGQVGYSTFRGFLPLLILSFFTLGLAGAILSDHLLPEAGVEENRMGDTRSIWKTISSLPHIKEGDSSSLPSSSYASSPNAVDHLKRARKLHYEDVDIPAAIAEYEKAAMLEPDNPDIHYELARAYLTQIATVSSTEAAIRELEKVIALEPSHLDARKDLALLYTTCHRPDHERAFELLEKGRRLAPTDIEILIALGEVSMRQGKPITARAYLWEAHRLNPTDPRPYNAIGQTYYEEGRFEDAVRYFREALHSLEGAPDEMILALSGRFSTDLQAAEISAELHQKVEEKGW